MAGYATLHDLLGSSVFITDGRSRIGDATLFPTSKTTRIMASQATVLDSGAEVTG